VKKQIDISLTLHGFNAERANLHLSAKVQHFYEIGVHLLPIEIWMAITGVR
jgi:hypothetical protein